MSQQEFHTGHLKKIASDNLEEVAERIVQNRYDTDLDPYYSTYLEMLLDEGDYILFEDSLFVVDKEINRRDLSDFCFLQKRGKNRYYYIASFYNGGTDLSEVLTDELKKLL